jgi:hypothetical protein
MKYHKIGEVYFGFINLSISTIIKYYINFFDGLSMLITCIDSNPKVINLSKWMKYLDIRKFNYKIIGNSVWIPQKYISELLIGSKTFYGFDEVYLLKNIPKIGLIDDNVYTTDGYDFSKCVPDNFLNKFNNIGAIRYLSDGLGLNFGCESIEIVENLKDIEKLFRESNYGKTDKGRKS